MSVFGRGRHRDTGDYPGWDDDSLDGLRDAPVIPRQPVEGSPPWPIQPTLPPASDVAAAHAATWTPQPQPTVIFTADRTITKEQQAAFSAYMDEPAEFTARVEPSEPLARAREMLAGDPTFGWALRHAPLADLAGLFDPEAPDGE